MGTPSRSIDGRWAEVFAAPGISGDELTDSLTAQEEIVRAWTAAGSADALALIHPRDTDHLEEIILRLQRVPVTIARTRPQVLLSELLSELVNGSG